MTDWTKKRTTDAAIRVAGALCCAASYLSTSALVHPRAAAPAAQPGALAYALAAIAFLGASIGAALVVLGHHIFDQIEVSGRRQHRPAPLVTRPQRSGATNVARSGGEWSVAGIDLRIAPRASVAAADLPLPWRALDLTARPSTDARLVRQW